MPLPPGPAAPSLVNAARFQRAPLDWLLACQARYGNVFTARFLGFGTGVYVAEPDAIRELFSGDQTDLHAGEANAILEPMLGPSSVLVLDGPRHLRQRRLLLPPFHGLRVEAARVAMREAAEREVSTWRPGDELVLRERMRAVTFEVICRAVFGVTERRRVERLRAALMAVIDLGSIFLIPAIMRADLGRLSPGGILARRLRAADALLYEEIARRRSEPDLAERSDVLSLLLCARDEDGSALTDAELRDELFTLLAAGHETTATSLTFALDFLMRDPARLGRLREELATGDRAYLEAVAKETLRLRPVIDAAERTLKGPRTVAGWHLPAGVKVYPAIALVHLREDLFSAAREFRPERWLDGDAEPYTWLPFGGGIRRCIGAAFAQAEMAEVLREVVQRADLTPVRAHSDPIVLRGITLAPKHGVRARVAGVRAAGVRPTPQTAQPA